MWTLTSGSHGPNHAIKKPGEKKVGFVPETEKKKGFVTQSVTPEALRQFPVFITTL